MRVKECSNGMGIEVHQNETRQTAFWPLRHETKQIEQNGMNVSKLPWNDRHDQYACTTKVTHSNVWMPVRSSRLMGGTAKCSGAS